MGEVEEEDDWKIELVGPDDPKRSKSHFNAIDVSESLANRPIFKLEAKVSLSASAPLSDVINTISISGSKAFCVAVHDHVFIFDSLCKSQLATVTFDCDIDVMSFNRTSDFLVVGDRMGAIHFVELGTQNIVFSQQIAKSDGQKKTFVKLVVGSMETQAAEELLVILSNMRVLRFSHVNFDSLLVAIASKNAALGQKVKKEISIETVDIIAHGVDCVYDAFITYSPDHSTVYMFGDGAIPMSIWTRPYPFSLCTGTAGVTSLSDQVVLTCNLILECGIIKAFGIRDYYIVLDREHRLSIWNLKTRVLLLLHQHEKFKDIASIGEVRESPDSPSVPVISALTCDNRDNAVFSVLLLPELNRVFSCKVSKNSWLSSRCSANSEYESFPALIEHGSDSEEAHPEFTILDLSQILPTTELLSLVQCGRYQEAEKMALKFDLNVEVVARAFVDNLMQTNPVLDELELNQLFQKMDTISEKEFVISALIELKFSNYETTWKALVYAHSLAREAGTISDSTSNQLSEAIHRFGTFRFLQDVSFDASLWQAFRTADILEYVARLFSDGQVEKGIIIWKRHITAIDPSSLHTLLMVVPHGSPISILENWIRDDLAPLAVSDDIIKVLVDWIESHASSIERNENAAHNALTFAQILNHIRPQNGSRLLSTTPFSYVKLAESASKQTELPAKTSILLDSLVDLVYLHESHDLKMSLTQYQQLSCSQIAVRLISHLHESDLLSEAISLHLKPYCKRHSLDADEVLRDYCVNFLEQASRESSSLSVVSWESQVLAIVENIFSVNFKIEVVMAVMKITVIPWSNSLEKIMKQILNFKGCELVNFRRQYDLLKIKRLLQRYDIHDLNLNNGCMLNYLLRHMLNRLDISESLKDGLYFAETFKLPLEGIYTERMQILCKNNRLDDAINLLSSISETCVAKFCGEEMVTWIECQLETIADGTDNRSYLLIGIHFSKALAEMLNHSSTVDVHRFGDVADAHVQSERQNFLTIAAQLEVMLLLNDEFDMKLHRSALQTSKTKEKCLRSYISNSLLKKAKSGLETKSARLASILGLPRITLYITLTLEYIANGEFEAAFLKCKEVIAKEKAAEAYTFFRVIQRAVLEEYFSKISQSPCRLVIQILECCQMSLALCPEHDLESAISDFCFCDSMATVFSYTDQGNYEMYISRNNDELLSFEGSSSSESRPQLPQLPDPKASFDSFGNIIFADMYIDSGLVLDCTSAMGLVKAFYDTTFKQKIPTPVVGEKKETGKGKGVFVTELATDRQTEFELNLVDCLLQNKIFLPGLQVFFRYLEMYVGEYREKSTVPVPLPQTLMKYPTALTEGLVKKITGVRCVDQTLAFSALITFPLEMAFNLFKSGLATVESDYNRLERFAAIGIACATAWKQRTFLLDCNTILLNARWWAQLKLLRIPFDEDCFRKSRFGEYQRDLVPLLLERTSMDVVTALEFGRAFNIEDDFVLFEYTKALLLSQPLGFESLIVGVLEDIDRKEKLISIIQEVCIPNISSYNYQGLRFSYKILAQLQESLKIDTVSSKKSIDVLDILQGYQRKFSPGNTELSLVAKELGIKVGDEPEEFIDELKLKCPHAFRRLPFHLLMREPWRIFRRELSENTVAQLIPLTIPLAIDADKFRITVVENIIQEAKESVTMYKRLESPVKFSDIKPILLQINDAQLALSTAIYVTEEIPISLEKTLAIQVTIQLADRLVQQNPGVESFKKRAAALRETLAKAETEYQLHTLGLSHLLSLLKKPLDLIGHLYDQDIQLKDKTISIHQLADDIAKRNGLDIERYRLHLIKVWLASTTESSVAEQAFLPSIRIQIDIGPTYSSEMAIQRKVLRLVEAAKGGLKELMETAYSKNKKIVTLTRIRAVSVILRHVDQASFPDFNDVREYLTLLLYLADFEELRIPQTILEFHSADKAALVRSLCVTNGREAKGIQLICNICLDYRIYEVPLWEKSLMQLVALEAFEYLVTILDRVSSPVLPLLTRLQCLPSVWEKTIFGMLKQAARVDSPFLSTLISLIQKCPFVPKVPWNEIVRGIISQADDFLTALEGLSQLGRTTPGVTESIHLALDEDDSRLRAILDDNFVLNFQRKMGPIVFDFINSRKLFAMIANKKYFTSFLHYIVKSNTFQGFLAEMIRANRIANTYQFLSFYQKTIGTQISGEDKKTQDLLGLLSKNNLLEETSIVMNWSDLNDENAAPSNN